MSTTPKPASFLSGGSTNFRYTEKSNPDTSNLDFLTYGVYEISGDASSGVLAHPDEEALLFSWRGESSVRLEDTEYGLDHYDVLYVPRGAPYRIEGRNGTR